MGRAPIELSTTDASLSIALIHGIGSDHSTWEPVLPALRKLGDCGTFDLFGFGENMDRQPAGSIDDLCHGLWGDIQREPSLQPLVLVGHSLGGVVAQLLAERHPEAVVGVVNVEGNLTASDTFLSRQAIETNDFDGWFARFIKLQGLRLNYSTDCRIDQNVFRAVARDLVGLSENGHLLTRLTRLPMPVLYCHGTESFSDESRAALYATRIDKKEFPGASHWLHREQPWEFVAAVEEFMAAHSLMPASHDASDSFGFGA